MKHFTPRQPKGRHFAWSRTISHDGALLTYRLFRREQVSGRLRPVELQYMRIAPRKMIAGDLKIARKVLRDRVDEIDLAAMGIAA